MSPSTAGGMPSTSAAGRSRPSRQWDVAAPHRLGRHVGRRLGYHRSAGKTVTFDTVVSSPATARCNVIDSIGGGTFVHLQHHRPGGAPQHRRHDQHQQARHRLGGIAELRLVAVGSGRHGWRPARRDRPERTGGISLGHPHRLRDESDRGGRLRVDRRLRRQHHRRPVDRGQFHSSRDAAGSDFLLVGHGWVGKRRPGRDGRARTGNLGALGAGLMSLLGFAWRRKEVDSCQLTVVR